MRRKYKLTGCARFLIFLLIAIPVVYIAATMVTGTSPLEEINRLLGRDGEERKIQSPTPTTTTDSDTTSLVIPTPAEQVTETEERQIESTISNKELLNRIEQLEKRLSEMEQKLE